VLPLVAPEQVHRQVRVALPALVVAVRVAVVVAVVELLALQ
jgi:hypothetical protein